MSTLVGRSGREYPQGEVLRRHPKNAEYDIYKTQSEGQSFVYKRVSESFFDQSQRLAKEFAGTRYLRMPTDWDVQTRTLFYPWFRDSLLSLLQNHQDLPKPAIKKILQRTSEAVKEFHDKDWIHIDVKPDNIMVDWCPNEQGTPIVEQVALGDFDIALKLKGGRSLSGPRPIGNIFWRSPEGQTGKGVAKPSDVYSLALVYLYALGGAPLLIPGEEDLKELAKTNKGLLLEILTRHFNLFGPLPRALLEHINDEKWSELLRIASEISDETVRENPEWRIEQWPEGIIPRLDLVGKSLISRMSKLDPAARATLDEVLEHSWWQKDV